MGLGYVTALVQRKKCNEIEPKSCHYMRSFIHCPLLCCAAYSFGPSGNRTANPDAVLALLYSTRSCP